MISFYDLTYKIGSKLLFNSINMTLLPSAAILLKGSNGSGKTSLLRLIAGIEEPSCGNILISTGDMMQTALESSPSLVCYINHDNGLYDEMSVLDNLKLWSKILESDALIPAAIKFFELEELLDKKCYFLSSGQKMRCALARLIFSKAKIWLIDEADSALDEYWRGKLAGLIETKLNNGGIAVISSHQKPIIKNMQILNMDEFKG